MTKTAFTPEPMTYENWREYIRVELSKVRKKQDWKYNISVTQSFKEAMDKVRIDRVGEGEPVSYNDIIKESLINNPEIKKYL